MRWSYCAMFVFMGSFGEVVRGVFKMVCGLNGDGMEVGAVGVGSIL